MKQTKLAILLLGLLMMVGCESKNTSPNEVKDIEYKNCHQKIVLKNEVVLYYNFCMEDKIKISSGDSVYFIGDNIIRIKRDGTILKDSVVLEVGYY